VHKTPGPFLALQPGELPGDPELGGWRPLPRSTGRDFQRQTASLSEWRVSTGPISLTEAIRLVAHRVRIFNLREALGMVAARLAVRESSTIA